MDYYIQTNTTDKPIDGRIPWDLVCSHCGETLETVWLTHPETMTITPWVTEIMDDHLEYHCTDGITD